MKINNEKGVTLVALVVTIVVLTILSGAVVFTLNGTHGMFGTTRNMQNNYVQHEEETNTKTKRILDKWGNVIDKTGIDPALSVD